jgi:hypothetical protein
MDINFNIQIPDMILNSLVYIALVIIVIIVIIVLLRYLFAVIFIMPATLEHPADMVTFAKAILSYP